MNFLKAPAMVCLASTLFFTSQGQTGNTGNLQGNWQTGGPYGVGQSCQIIQQGNALTFINEFGQQYSGRYIDASSIVANDREGGLQGTISADGGRIDWANGAWWIRSYSLEPETATSASKTNQNDNAVSEIAESWNAKGQALYNQGKYDDALQAYGNALKSNEDFEVTWSNIGAAYEAKGDLESAISAYEHLAMIGGSTEKEMRAKVSELKKELESGSADQGEAQYDLDQSEEESGPPELGVALGRISEELSIEGDWQMGGPMRADQPCKIIQQGTALTFINEMGQQSSGRYIDANTVVADDWGGLIGKISFDGSRIDWANGAWWVTSSTSNPSGQVSTYTPNLAGNWRMGSRPTADSCMITQNGNELIFQNEKQEQSPGRFLDASTVVADNWGGLTGKISSDGNGIDWANGSWWIKTG